MRKILLTLVGLTSFLSFGQLSGNKTVLVDYPTIAAFVTDVNTQGVLIGGGGVTLIVPSGYSETAPVGGYNITATGTAAENITIVGAGSPQPIITANNALVAGSLTDAIFKIIGGDYINIANLDMRENAANTTTAAATNNMTEFGVALFYSTTTDGAQRNSVINNTITLNRTYPNSFGVYSNVRHNATAVATAADITALSGSNSNNKVYGNTISNVNMGIAFIGSGVAANQDQGNDIGGTGVSTGNIISNWGGAGATGGYISNSGTSYCIFMNHQTGENVSYNTLTSATVSGTAVTFRGIVKDYTTTSATGTFTSTISNNTITMTNGFTSGTFQHIASAGLASLSTATININNNSILNSAVTGAASSSNIVGIINSSAPGVLNISSNVIRGLNSTATTGGVTGISNSGAVVTTINLNNNAFGNGAGNYVTFSVGTTGAINAVTNSGGAATSNLSISGNNVQGISQTGTTSSTHFYLVNSAATLSQNISNNTFTNITNPSTGNVRFIANDVALPTAASTVVASNNQIVTAYNKTGAGGTVFFYYTTGTPSSVVGSTKTYNSNNFSNVTLTGATTLSGWSDLEGTPGPNKNFTNNTFSNITGGTSAMTIISNQWSGSVLVQNNVISNITGQSSIVGINSSVNNGSTAGMVHTFNNNTITNLSSTGTGGNVTGISIGANAVPTNNVTNNIISGLSSTSATAQILGIITSATAVVNVTGNTVFGISASGATPTFIGGIATTAGSTVNVNNNKVYNISVSGVMTTNAINGIALQGGTTVNAYNNLISGLTAPAANAVNAITGIQVNSATTSSVYNIDYNTVYVNASSTGTNFGTTGIYHTVNATSTTAALDLRNNIIINESTPNGTGLTVAFRRSGTALNNYSANSNRNLFYAGTPGASRLIMNDGTTSYQTMTLYQAAVAPRDINSFTGEAAFTGSGYGTAGNFFISLTGSSSDFLRPVAGITTQVEAGGSPVTSPSITTDYSGVTRPSTPDLGAYEFAGITPAPVITLNSVTPPTTAQCSATARLVSVNITTASGTITGANLVYAVNGTAQTPIAMTNVSGSTWTGTIPVPTPTNASITWGVTATNSIPISSSYSGTPYADEPLFGYTAASSASSTTVCSGSPTSLSALLNNPAAPTTYPTVSIVNPTTDEDLRTVRITQGATILLNNTSVINSLTGTIGTATGTAGSYSNFTAVATTPLTAGQSYNLFVASIDAPSYFTNYASAFIDFNRDGDFADAGESLIPTTGVTLNAATDNGNDSITTAFTVPASALNGLTRMRVVITETGQTNAAGSLNNGYGEFEDYTVQISGGTAGTTNNITSVSWSDGVTTVGTGNPLSVNPTSTTTYTGTITALGCTINTPTTTVTVNPLPSAPTATNSAQCGTQIPTASVTSTTGLPTPTFVWHDAPTAGAVLQSSTSTTYTSNVATTTTFYVSELNTVTGCESARTAVTVTVAAADGILASINNATICIGSSVNLSVVNTNGTPNQSYTYTWTNAQTGSGLTSQGGANITVTPTQPGSYIYDVSGVDGGCNAVSSVSLTVNPFTVTVTPINITCNGYNNGSFSLSGATCGTVDVVSVDGGTFGPIPTNLAPGTYAIVVRNTAGFTSASQNITITQPTTVIGTPTGTNAAVCQNAATANVSASSSITPATTSGSLVVSFNVATQPTENSATTVPTVAASPNVIATATMAALPAGATITSANLNYNGIQATGSSWMSDVRLGLTGAATQAYTGGTGTANNAGTFNYTAPVTPASINVAGGSISLHYFDFFSDNAGSEATFPTGAGVANLTINYSIPNVSTISWWDASTGGTQVGTGSPLNAVGTSVLPNTSTPGTYTLYAQGNYTGCASVNRTAVTVTVNSLPTVNAGIDQTVCAGTPVTLTGSGTATGYAWNNGVTNNVAFTPASTLTYTVTGTDGNGCTNTDQAVVTVNALPTVNAGVDQTVCAGTSVTLTGSGTATGYAWNNGVTNGVAFTPASTLTYTVTGTDGNGCTNTDQVVVNVNALPTVNAGTDQTVCSGTSVTLTGSGTATGYAWDNGISNGVAFTATATTTYTVTGTDGNGCTNTDQVIVNVNALPTVNAGSDQTVCAGTSVTLTGSGTATGYAWNNGVTNGVAFIPVSTMTYTVTGTDGNGCTNTDQVIVNVNALPTVSAGADQAACSGNSVVLTGTGTATGYAWNNGVTNGVAFTPVSTMTYTVTGTDGNGCTNTDQVIVTVGNPTTGTDVQTACDSYTWINGVTYTASNNTATFTLTNAAGCDSIVTLNLTINNSTTGTDVQTACDSYTWIDGVTYTASTNTPTFTLTNAVGCDSLVTLNLTITNSTTGTDVQTACDSYTWIDGVTYTASNNSATFTLTNAAGCDSIVTLNLTITNSTTGTDVQTACGTYTWIDGVTYTASNNTATFTLTNAAGCDSIVTLNLTINAIPNATATDNGNATITASAGASYQWVNCTTGLAVSGANAQTFAPSANGSYAVVVTNASGCSDTSSCVNINNVGVKELSSEYISVYPNPTHNNVTITMTAQEANVVVVDGAGKTLKIATIKNGDQISLEEFATGVYFLNITTEFGTQLVKVSKN